MTVINPPAWLQAGEYPAYIDRLVSSSLVAEPGVVKTGDLAVTQNSTPGMSVVVSSGRAWIRDGVGSVANQGMYNFVNLGNEVLSVAIAHATSYRVDRVIALVEDAELSGTTNLASLTVLTGTNASTLAGAQALTPAVPTRAISLATVTVNPSATAITNANISSSVAVSKLHGEMAPGVVVSSSSSRPTGSSRFLGMMIYETDTQRTWQWNGSEWQFRGGPGPRAYAHRPGTWPINAGDLRYLQSLEPYTGSNFETAYFTFVDNASTGDRIRVKQSGMYAMEIFSKFANSTTNVNIILNAYVAVNTSSLPGGTAEYPSVSGRYLQGTNRQHDSRTVFLPANSEIAVQYNANVDGTAVEEFWLGLTLVG